jgi:hypothetical protein
MIHYHSPKVSKRFVQAYDPLKPNFMGPGFYGQELAPSLDLHTHDEATVKRVLKTIAYPDNGKIQMHVYNLPYNLPEFYNGLASSTLRDDGTGATAFLLLGRCTSIPYVMTEFVVPHEAGHCYQYRYLPDYGRDGKDKNWKMYMKIAGLSDKRQRSARHHENNREIFANTFRILFSPYQPDFWPHKAKHPLKIKGLKSYLSKVLK